MIHWSGESATTSAIWDNVGKQWTPGPTMDRSRADPLVAYVKEDMIWILGKIIAFGSRVSTNVTFVNLLSTMKTI